MIFMFNYCNDVAAASSCGFNCCLTRGGRRVREKILDSLSYVLEQMFSSKVNQHKAVSCQITSFCIHIHLCKFSSIIPHGLFTCGYQISKSKDLRATVQHSATIFFPHQTSSTWSNFMKPQGAIRISNKRKSAPSFSQQQMQLKVSTLNWMLKKKKANKLILTQACMTNRAVKLLCKYLLPASADMNFSTGCF